MKGEELVVCIKCSFVVLFKGLGFCFVMVVEYECRIVLIRCKFISDLVVVGCNCFFFYSILMVNIFNGECRFLGKDIYSKV